MRHPYPYPEFIALGESGGAGNRKAEPIRLCPSVIPPASALRLLSSRALSSERAGRIYHDPINGKRRKFLTQNGPKKGASPLKTGF